MTRTLKGTSASRAKAAPELPTVAESGLPAYAPVGWFGLLAPAATPKAVFAKLSADVGAAGMLATSHGVGKLRSQ